MAKVEGVVIDYKKGSILNFEKASPLVDIKLTSKPHYIAIFPGLESIGISICSKTGEYLIALEVKEFFKCNIYKDSKNLLEKLFYLKEIESLIVCKNLSEKYNKVNREIENIINKSHILSRANKIVLYINEWKDALLEDGHSMEDKVILNHIKDNIVGLDTYSKRCSKEHTGVLACGLVKWFNTNYKSSSRGRYLK